jgi:RHS repeat-associated protein
MRQVLKAFELGVFAALIALLMPAHLAGQVRYGAYPWTTSLPVQGGYVDATNGNLHIEIPIASMATRGRVPFIAKLVYDSHIWQQVTVGGSLTWQPTNVTGLVSAWGGWRLVTPAAGQVTYQTVPSTCAQRAGNVIIYLPYTIYQNFQWVAPDGHHINFGGSTNTGTSCKTAVSTFSGASKDDLGYHISVTSYTSSTTFAPDGTQLSPTIKDTNGNFYSAPNSAGDVTDTIGRTPVTTTTNGSTITYAVTNSAGSTSNFVVTTESIPVNTLFGQSGTTEFSGNITVVQSLTLPDNSSYQFTYDQGSTGTHFGTLSGITLPTGGTVSYGQSVFQDAFGSKNLYVSSYTLGSGQWTYSPQVLTTCGTNCSEQVTVTQPSGDQQLYTLNTQTGGITGSLWCTQKAFYTGSVAPANLLNSVTIGYSNSTGGVLPVSYVTTVPVPGGNLSSKVTIVYDSTNFGNKMTQNEWNFRSGSFPSSPDRVTSYTYLTDSNNNIVNKAATVKISDGSNHVVSETDIQYDGSTGNPTGGTTINGVFGHDDTNYGSSYTARGNVTEVDTNVPAGLGTLRTSISYDTTGQPLKTITPFGNTTTYLYTDCYRQDNNGYNPPSSYSVSQVTNAFATTVTKTIYGIHGGQSQQSTGLCYFFGSSKLASATDPNNATTYMHFGDSLDRPTAVVPQLGWTVWTYSSSEIQVDKYLGINDSSPSPGCSSCRHDETVLDNLGRFSQAELVNDPDGPSVTGSATYDTTGRIASSGNPYRSVSDTTYGFEVPSYDGLSRTTRIQHADGNSVKSFYGVAISSSGFTGANSSQLCSTSTYGYGYPVLSVDEANNGREIWIDAFGRTIETDEPNSSGSLTSNTCYSYDLINDLLKVVHGTQTRTYTYDAIGRLTSETIPESGGTTFAYSGSTCIDDGLALPCQQTDARGVTISSSYGSFDRLAQRTYSDGTPTVTYSYDQASANGLTIANGVGRLTSMTDGSGTTAWSYDADGRVVTEQRTLGGVTKTTSYAYSGDGSLKSITYPTGRTVSYSIGNAQRTLQATDSNGAQYALLASYAATGALSSVVYGRVSGGFNGMTASQTYDNRLDLNSIQASSTAGGAINLAYCFYQWVTGACQPGGSIPNNGNVTAIANNNDTGRTETFAYDPLNRIQSAATQATLGADCWGQSFGIDALANLTTMNSTQTGCSVGTLSVTASQTTNQLSTTSPPFGYDSAGNMTADATGKTYTFDAEDRINSASGMTGGPYCYTYDGNGMRVEKANGNTCSSPTQVDTLYWRAITGDVLAETDTQGNTKSEYIYFAGEKIAWWDGTQSQSALYFVYTDALGTTKTITTASGTVCYDSEFTPYGQEINHTNNCSGTNSYNYKFTGYETDVETGLNYAFARYYNPRLGRFMSPDPVGYAVADTGDPQTWNAYAYVRNNPLRFIDPTGMDHEVPVPCTADICVTSTCPPDCAPVPPTGNPCIDYGIGCGSGGPGGGAGRSGSAPPKKGKVLACTVATANKISIAGLINVNASKHPVGAQLVNAFLGNTFSGIATTVSQLASAFSQPSVSAVEQFGGDLAANGVGAGLPIAGNNIFGKGAVGVATDTAVNGIAKAATGSAVIGATETTVAEAAGYAHIGVDLVIFLGSAAYCHAHR